MNRKLQIAALGAAVMVTFWAGMTFARGFGGVSGRNPYAESGGSGQFGAGSRSGSYTTQRGGTINYGAAGVGGRGEGGGAAGRGVYGVEGTTAGGRDYASAGRVGGAVGAGGDAV